MVAFVCVLKKRGLFRALAAIIDTKSSTTEEHIKRTRQTCFHKSLELGIVYRYLLFAVSNQDDKFMMPGCAKQRSEEPAAL